MTIRAKGETRTQCRDGYGDWVPRLAEGIALIRKEIDEGAYTSTQSHHILVRALYLGSSQQQMLDIVLKTVNRVNHDRFAGAKRWHLMLGNFKAEAMMGSYRLTRYFIYREDPSWNHFPNPNGTKSVVKDSRGVMAFPAVNFKPIDESKFYIPKPEA